MGSLNKKRNIYEKLRQVQETQNKAYPIPETSRPEEVSPQGGGKGLRCQENVLPSGDGPAPSAPRGPRQPKRCPGGRGSLRRDPGGLSCPGMTWPLPAPPHLEKEKGPRHLCGYEVVGFGAQRSLKGVGRQHCILLQN